MNDESRPIVSLTRQVTALSKDPAAALATRALHGLRVRETSEYWLQKGLEHERERLYEQSFWCFSRGLDINPNHAELQFQTGLAYLHGAGVGMDDKAALAWQQKSAEQGHAGAQYMLYLHYIHGVAIARDIRKAAFWLERAASQVPDYTSNSDHLALAYENGDGVIKDRDIALNWWRRAADQGNDEALYRVGVAYWDGVQVPLDQTQAIVWWHKAADRGHATANFVLGTLYLTGFLVPQDDVKASAHLRKAAQAGHADAQNWLGISYEVGQGVDQDLEEAALWYRKAAEQKQENAVATSRECANLCGFRWRSLLIDGAKALSCEQNAIDSCARRVGRVIWLPLKREGSAPEAGAAATRSGQDERPSRPTRRSLSRRY